MALDALFIGHLAQELNDTVAGMKIDKVRQPERDAVVLALRGNGKSLKLLMCFGSGNARVCITQAEYENPAQPPMFCMLLRKYLIGARILAVTQPEGERMLQFDLTAYDEMGQASPLTIAMELLGRNANMVIIDAEGRIIDAARRVDAEMSALRQLLPGMLYHMPPKPEPGKFSGFSPLIRRELQFRGLPEEIQSLQGIPVYPCLLTENGAPKDFTFMDILQYGPGVECIRCDGWSQLLEDYYAEKDKAEYLRSHAKSMTKTVRGARTRTERKLQLRRQEMLSAANREEDRRRADLITANIWRMKPGMASVQLEDFYEPDCPTVTVPLDSRKSPQQNAAAYYKQYNKKKTAAEYLQRLIAENEAEMDYLDSVADELTRVGSRQELQDIRTELEQAGYLRAPKDSRKQRRPKPSQPMEFTTTAGLQVLVGRNNTQNDELTFRIARRTDLWLHVLQLHGAHVILRCEDRQPDEQSVYEAACLAAYFSEGAQAGRVAVDAAPVRFVKKPSGARPGKVIYTNQRTIMAEPRKP